MNQARKDIGERLELVNQGLKNAPFNPGTYLQIQSNVAYFHQSRTSHGKGGHQRPGIFPKMGFELEKFHRSGREKRRRGLLSVLDWFEKNPHSGLYPRQIPVPCVDSKWWEAHKNFVVSFLLELGKKGEDFYSICGLKA